MIEQPFMHYCHCGKWGAFGFKVRLLKNQRGEWFCSEHRPQSAPTFTQEERTLSTPQRFLVRCTLCNEALDSRTDNGSIAQIVTGGWAKKRSGGGTNAVMDLQLGDKWAHTYCIERKTSGYQARMF